MSLFPRRRSGRLFSQTGRVVFDFLTVLAVTSTSIFMINVAAAQTVPVPVLSLIMPFDFGLTQTAIAAVHGGLAGGDALVEASVSSADAGASALAMTLACTLFAALSAATLMMYRRLKSSQAWRWSAHFE